MNKMHPTQCEATDPPRATKEILLWNRGRCLPNLPGGPCCCGRLAPPAGGTRGRRGLLLARSSGTGTLWPGVFNSYNVQRCLNLVDPTRNKSGSSHDVIEAHWNPVRSLFVSWSWTWVIPPLWVVASRQHDVVSHSWGHEVDIGCDVLQIFPNYANLL